MVYGSRVKIPRLPFIQFIETLPCCCPSIKRDVIERHLDAWFGHERLEAYRHAHDIILRQELPQYERNHMGGIAISKPPEQETIWKNVLIDETSS